MDNVFSIYSRKSPCESLLMTKDEFNNFYSSSIENAINNNDAHINTCTDCSGRYFVENREVLSNRINMFLKALSESLENPNG